MCHALKNLGTCKSLEAAEALVKAEKAHISRGQNVMRCDTKKFGQAHTG